MIYQCGEDVASSVDHTFGEATYLRLDNFDDDACASGSSTTVVVADGKCHAQFMTTLDGSELSFLTVINANGSASWTSFRSTNCSGDIVKDTLIDEQQLSSNACANKGKAYANTGASNETEGSDNGGTRSVGGSISHVVASVAVLAIAFAP